MKDATSTRPSVLERASHGDMEEFVAIYAPLVHRVACWYGLRVNDADDVCQNVMLQLFERLADFRYDRGIGRFRSYVWRVAHGHVVTELRARGRRVTQPLETEPRAPPGAEPDRVFDEEHARSMLLVAMDRARVGVKFTTYASFEATELNGYSNTEAARLLGLTPNVVSQNRGRMLARIREHLRAMEGAEVE